MLKLIVNWRRLRCFKAGLYSFRSGRVLATMALDIILFLPGDYYFNAYVIFFL
jgi:hypothetical protein